MPQIYLRETFNRLRLLSGGALLGFLAVPGTSQADTLNEKAAEAAPIEAGDIVVTARHRQERAQDVPVALTALNADLIRQRGDYTIGAIPQIAPSLQVFSFNPRNTNINIRGLGSNVAVANDGLDNGVGFYVDDVYYGRPGQAQFDLVDLERIEVLRGPQGTLFGRNTTAGALNITTRLPEFEFGGEAEATIGNYGYHQVRAALTGPLTDWAAFRVTIADTHRDGTVLRLRTGDKVHGYDNLTARGQLLLRSEDEQLQVRLIGDYSRQKLNCCARLVDGVFTSFDDGRTIPNNFAIRAARAGYTLPSSSAFDRVTDVDSPFQANMNQWGVSGKIDWDTGPVTLTSITAYRRWNWYPQNDNDFIGLNINTQSQMENFQQQFSQEFRIASNGDSRVSYVLGAYHFWQIIDGVGRNSYGTDAPQWLFPTQYALDPVATTRGVSNFVTGSNSNPETRSYAAFGQFTYQIIPDALSVTGGLRFTHEKKTGSYEQFWLEGLSYDGLTPAQITFANNLRSSLNPVTQYSASLKDNSVSGLLTLSYKVAPDVLVYATYSRGSKSGGLNLVNLPSGIGPTIGPEQVDNYEAGLKSQFLDRRLTVNLAGFWTDITNYQTILVDQNPSNGQPRTYIANVPAVRARGFEFDGSFAVTQQINLTASVAYTNATYADFTNGPAPIEATPASGPPIRDLTGEPLSGAPKWALSTGADFVFPVSSTFGTNAEIYGRADYSWRSSYYTEASNSRHALVPAYGTANARLGLRFNDSLIDVSVWAKNLFDKDYVDTLRVVATGLVTATVGDPRTFGATLRSRF